MNIWYYNINKIIDPEKILLFTHKLLWHYSNTTIAVFLPRFCCRVSLGFLNYNSTVSLATFVFACFFCTKWNTFSFLVTHLREQVETIVPFLCGGKPFLNIFCHSCIVLSSYQTPCLGMCGRWKLVPSFLLCFVLFCFVLFCFVLFCFVLFCFLRQDFSV